MLLTFQMYLLPVLIFFSNYFVAFDPPVFDEIKIIIIILLATCTSRRAELRCAAINAMFQSIMHTRAAQ